MGPETISLLGTGGSYVVAVIIVVTLFLRHLRHCQKQDREEREKERKLLLDVIVNDLAHVGESLMEVKIALQKLNGKGGG